MHTFASRLMFTLLLAPPAFAASSMDLAVTGSITPNACEPLISGEGTIDYGKMSFSALNPEQHTPLPAQTMPISVRCEGPTFFTLTTIDNRAGTSANHANWHGLGLTPTGEKIGGAAFHLYNPVADGAPAHLITSWDGGMTWEPDDTLSHTSLTAVAASNTDLVPAAVTDFDADIGVLSHLAPANGMTLTDEVPLDGNATVQLSYL